MKQVLVCKNCDEILSRPVTIHEEYIERPVIVSKSFFAKMFHFKKNVEQKGENQVYVNKYGKMKNICDEGICLKSETAIWLGIKSEVMSFTPQFWMNCNDLYKMELDEDIIEGQWCCGPSGITGPNILCRCKALIGTACLECGLPDTFIPDNEKVKWKNVK